MVVAIVAIAFGVNRRQLPVSPAVPTPTRLHPPSPAPSPTARRDDPVRGLPTATFGPVLAPLNPPGERARLQRGAGDARSTPPSSTRRPSSRRRATIVLCLQPEPRAQHRERLRDLARNHFYDGIPFQRVVAGFVVQGGDPTVHRRRAAAPATPSATCGEGGPGFQFNDEPVHQAVRRGLRRHGEQRHQHQRLAVLHLHRRRHDAAAAARTTCSARSSREWTSP